MTSPQASVAFFQTLQLAMRGMGRHGMHPYAHLPHYINEICPPHCASPHPMPSQTDWVVLSMSGSLLSAQVSAWHFMTPQLQMGGWETLVQLAIIIPAISEAHLEEEGEKHSQYAPPSAGQHPFSETYKLFTHWGLIKIC